MMTTVFVLHLLSLVSFLVAAVGPPTGRVNMTAVGLFFLVFSMMVPR